MSASGKRSFLLAVILGTILMILALLLWSRFSSSIWPPYGGPLIIGYFIATPIGGLLAGYIARSTVRGAFAGLLSGVMTHLVMVLVIFWWLETQVESGHTIGWSYFYSSLLSLSLIPGLWGAWFGLIGGFIRGLMRRRKD